MRVEKRAHLPFLAEDRDWDGRNNSKDETDERRLCADSGKGGYTDGVPYLGRVWKEKLCLSE